MWFVVAMVLLSAIFSSFSSLTSSRAADRANATANELRVEVVRRDAAGCVDDWDRVTGSRDSISFSITGVVAMFVGVFPNANPDVVARVERSASDTIQTAQTQIPDPDCDLEEAKRLLRELRGG